ncbi:MAG: TetR/AcrR family transcriptional regulator [Myxococcota bacterium]
MIRPGVEVQTKRILEATLELLATHPVEDLTASKVAQEAGTSRATFYRCFKSIQEVIESLYADFSASIIERLTGQLGEEADERWLGGVVRRVVMDAHQMGPALVSLYREELRPDSIGGRYARDRVQRQVELLQQWWARSEEAPLEDEVFVLIVNLLQMSGLRAATLEEREVDGVIASSIFAIEAMIAHHRTGRPTPSPVS